jgi:hypothetical protein
VKAVQSIDELSLLRCACHSFQLEVVAACGTVMHKALFEKIRIAVNIIRRSDQLRRHLQQLQKDHSAYFLDFIAEFLE